jgi:penicillin amidase
MGRHLGATLSLLAAGLWRRIGPGRRPAVPDPLRVRGVDGEVCIRRDEAGVPHVFAGTLADLGFGQGLAVAQDRLWQMESLRRLAGGRLAELLGDRPVAAGGLFMPGSSLLAVDELYRRLRMYPVAREDARLLGGDARAVVEGFAGGVNAWLQRLRPGTLPPEYVLLGVEPTPWSVEDSLAIGKLIGWLLSLSFPAKPVLALLAGEPALRPFLPPDLAHATCILGSRLPDASARLDRLARVALGLLGTGVGSNNWVVSGARTASGLPLLCNDPHLLFSLPPLWHPIALTGPTHRVIGGSMPGIPMVLVGRNDALAWGFTAVMADDGDYYRETLDEAGRYLRDGAWHPVEVVEERFRVQGRGEVIRRLDFVRHGGVLCPLLPSEEGHSPTSYRWAGLEPWPGLDAILGMNRAGDLAAFEQAAQAYGVPAQNVVVADRAGSIAYFCAGKFPRRADACAGAALLDGARPEHAWQGYLAWAEHPRCVDPPEGFLATANNRPAARLPAGLAGGFWEPPYRATRVVALLAEQQGATVDDMARIQADLVSVQAGGLISALVRPAAPALADPAARRAAALLLGWDCAMQAASPAPVVFHLFYQRLLARCMEAALEARRPGLFRRYLSILHLAVPAADSRLLQLGPDPAIAPGLVEECLAAAWGDASARLGPDPARWRWGSLHTLTFHHALGRARHPVARALVALLRLDRGPYEAPGDGMTVNLAAFSLAEPFRAVAGPSYRQIIDLGRPDDSRWIVAGGACGDPRSPHYADQIPAWLRGEYRPMRFLADADRGRRQAEGSSRDSRAKASGA